MKPGRTIPQINGNVAFENLPYIEYRVNGRTPPEWIIDRYCTATDKDGDINPCENMTEEKTAELIERMVRGLWSNATRQGRSRD